MELIKDSPFETAWLVWMARPKTHYLTVVVKATFTLVESGVCPIDPDQALPTGDVYHDDDTSRSVRYESDMALIKPQGEFLLSGSAFSPDGSPKTAFLAAFKVGPIQKKMAIIGDRHYKKLFGGQTDPIPFISMPLCWERCFGGRKIRENPVGLGKDKSLVEGKAVIRLPNIEDPLELITNRQQRPRPHGAFPIHRNWPKRAQHAGTYDSKWLKTRWPWFPADMSWSFFNAAPEDQRIDGFFVGDETIKLLGLHRELGSLECELPRLRAKVILVENETERLKSLSPELDTIAIDTDVGKVYCLWRAVVEVPSETLEEYSHLYVTHEPLDEDRPLEVYQQRLYDLHEEEKEEEEEFEAVDIPMDEDIEEESFTPAQPPMPLVIRSSWETTRRSSELGGSLLSRPGGSLLLTPFPDPVPLDSPVLIPEMTPEEWEALHATDYDVEDDHISTVAEPGWIMPIDQVLEFRKFEFDADEITAVRTQVNRYPSQGTTTALLDRLSLYLAEEEETDVNTNVFKRPNEFADSSDEPHYEKTVVLPTLASLKNAGEELEPTTKIARDSLRATLSEQVGSFDEFDDETVTSQETQVLIDHTEAPQPPLPPLPPRTPPPRLTTLKQEEDETEPGLESPLWAGAIVPPDAQLRDVITQKIQVDPSVSAEAHRQQKQREDVLKAIAAGESLAKQDFTKANLSGCDLSGADFTEANLTDANLSKSKLDGTTLSGAILLRANLKGVTVKGGTLENAVLEEAQLNEARLEEVSFEHCTANEAVFAGAKFMRCRCARMELGGANLSTVRFDGTNFDGADLTGATLDDAVFIDSSLIDADLGAVSAKRVTLDGCHLTKLRASEGGDFTEASFVHAKIKGGRFSESIFRRANFSFAELDRAVFSQAQLNQATMLGCTLRDSYFDFATLAGVKLGKSDLYQARFENANMIRADLRGCNLYKAEFLGADIRGALFELANLKGTKLA